LFLGAVREEILEDKLSWLVVQVQAGEPEVKRAEFLL
jgi:hypothetical protein